VRSEDVDLTSNQFQDFKAFVKKWRISEYYTNPGPIQFNFDATHDRNITESAIMQF